MEEKKEIKILAIESSCDETAAAVVVNGRKVLSNIIFSQIDLHKLYGGVVPEIASRKHIEKINQVIEEALAGGIAPGVCLNVNIPKCDKVKGVKRVRSARGYWKEEFEERTDPHGRTYYWLTGSYHNQEPDDPETDLYWLDRDYATIVPCRPDLTAYDQL